MGIGMKNEIRFCVVTPHGRAVKLALRMYPWVVVYKARTPGGSKHANGGTVPSTWHFERHSADRAFKSNGYARGKPLGVYQTLPDELHGPMVKAHPPLCRDLSLDQQRDLHNTIAAWSKLYDFDAENKKVLTRAKGTRSPAGMPERLDGSAVCRG